MRAARSAAAAAFVLSAALAAPPSGAQAPSGAPGPATAAPSPGTDAVLRVIVVDVQQVQQQSRAAQGVQRALEAQRETFQREIQAQEDRLRAAERELADRRGELSQEQFAQRRREFELQVIEGQREVQARSRALEQALSESMRTVQQRIMQIVAEVALERGADIVLARNQVLIFDRSLDVTQTVVDRLNAQLPQVDVAVPQQ
jgi:outer membrane protein